MFRFIALLLAIIMCTVSVAVVYYNKDPLLIDLYIIQFTNIPLGISLFLSMIFGVLITTFFIIGIVFMVITGAVRLGWMLAPYVFIGALLLWFFNLGG